MEAILSGCVCAFRCCGNLAHSEELAKMPRKYAEPGQVNFENQFSGNHFHRMPLNVSPKFPISNPATTPHSSSLNFLTLSDTTMV